MTHLSIVTELKKDIARTDQYQRESLNQKYGLKSWSVLLDPIKLREGYSASLEQQQGAAAKRKEYIETLRRGLQKLETERKNLTEVYLDPDIKMSKSEYLEQKNRIDEKISSTIEDIESTEMELRDIPKPADFETLEIFASKIRERLSENYTPTPQEKRRILELLHIKVFLDLDGIYKDRWWFKGRRR